MLLQGSLLVSHPEEAVFEMLDYRGILLSHAMGAESQIVVGQLVLLSFVAGLEARMLLLGTFMLSLPEMAEYEILDWQGPRPGVDEKAVSVMRS